MKTINERIEKIRIEAEEKVKQALIICEVLDKIGIEPSYIKSKPDFLSFKVSNFNDLKKIIDLFPPVKNAVLRFSGKDEQKTESPFTLCIQNYSHYTANSARIKYSSEIYDIWVELPLNLYPEESIMTLSVQGKHKGFGRYEYHFVKRFNRFGLIQYGGVIQGIGDRLTYCDKTEDKESFENFVLNGN